MAGSRRDFVYVSDDGGQFAVSLDASNAKIAGFGFVAYVGNPTLYRQPIGLRLRALLVVEPEKQIKRYLPVGNTTCAAWLGQIQTVTLIDYSDLSEATFEVIRKIPERQFNPPRVTDTYQVDPPN